VLRHELTHVATRLDTAADAPMWLTEGLAEYVGRRGYRDFAAVAPDLTAAVRAGELPAGLPTDADFRVDTDEATLAYQSAWSFAAFVADVYGEPKLRAMYLGVPTTVMTPIWNARLINDAVFAELFTEYCGALTKLAQGYGCTVADGLTLLPHDSRHLFDGAHPNEEGSALMALALA